MQSLLAAATILVLASVAKDQVAHAVTGWDPLAKISETGDISAD
jgi:hypothetical protein